MNQFFENKYRPDIDGLRAIAIFAVVTFHAFPNLLRGGFVGVDIFFVISGYLISSIIYVNLSKNNFSFLDFFARRIRRIFPALIIVMIFSILVGWLILTPQEYMQLGKHIAAGAAYVSNFIFWSESGYFDNISDTKPLLHLWSLGLEEQFYIILPFAIWILWKARFSILLSIVSIIIISFSLNIYLINNYSTAAFYLPITRFWELLCGSLLAFIIIKYPSISMPWHLKNYLSIFALILIAVGVIFFTKDIAFPGWYALLPVVGTMALIVSGPSAWVNKVVLSNRVLVWIGLISFPLYLWHWPLLVFAKLYSNQTLDRTDRILVVLVSILFAWATYVFIERPIKKIIKRKNLTITLSLILAFIGLIGLYIYVNKGLSTRFPEFLQQISSNRLENPEETKVGTCFLLLNQNYNDFQDCGLIRDKNKKTIFIWGDSHASQLIPGYIETFGNEYNIIQRTAAGCPPILKSSSDNLDRCDLINNYILSLIANESPDVVVLAANWVFYDWEKLSNTIDKLKKINISNIDLIGTVPQWIGSLPKQLHLFYSQNKITEIPKRMSFGLNENFIKLEPLMKTFSLKNKVNYLSAKDILCNPEGCITMLSDAPDSLTAWDYAHLTSSGSRFLVSKFPR